MINDYIHMNSVFPSPSLPSVVFGAKTPTTTVGDTQDPPHSVLLPSEPIKGPDNTQLPFRQLLPSSPSEEERGLREGEGKGDTNCRGIRTSVFTYYPPPSHLLPPPFTLSHCAEYKYPVQLHKVVRGRGGKGRGRGGGIHVYFCFWFGFSCVLSLRRKIQPIK